MAKLVKDFSPEERQHILQQLEEGLSLQDVAEANDTTWQIIRAIQRIALGDSGRRKTTQEEREIIWKRVSEVGLAQAAAENNLSENTILNWRWRYQMDETEHEATEVAEPKTDVTEVAEVAKVTEAPEVAEAPEATKDPKKKPAYNKKYTPEEKATILAFANEAGVVAASKKFDVSTTSINNWRKQAQPIQGQLPFQDEAQESAHQEASQGSAQESTVEHEKAKSIKRQRPSVHVPEEITMPQREEAVQSDSAVQSEPTIEALLPADSNVRALVARVQELNIEVAVLKERNAALTQKLEDFKASFINLLH